MLNVVALMGRLVADPELRTTQSGNSVCTFRVAVDRSYAPQGEERQADFITVTAWRKTAELRLEVFPERQHDLRAGPSGDPAVSGQER